VVVARLATLDVRTRAEWRAWLAEHHASLAEIWLVFHKRHTSKPSVDYEDAVEEALCFGWIDSLVRRLDDDRYARKFTPRRADSRWSGINRRRYAAVESRGLLTDAGRAHPPMARSAVAPLRREWPMRKYIERVFKADPRAWRYFKTLTPLQQRKYVGWIDSAKQEDTKRRRLREAVRLLARGEKLGLK
jgi:uncharacterized protein YdeI (YjbR/CyaY-like superfamily)